jgi:hypothetical protein
MRSARLFAALALALAAALPASAEAARARGLSLASAEAAVRAALAPAAVDAVLCWRPAAGLRALCLAAHPATQGEICRSLVHVRGAVGRPRARIVHANVCMRVELARPIDRG